MSCLTVLTDILDQVRFENMPCEVIEKIKILISDFLGIFEFGRNMQPAKRLKKALGDKKIIFNSEDLAYWIGGATRLLDLDDGHRFAMGHPGVPIMSAAFATAMTEEKQISGKLFLESIARAYEVYCYLGRCINPSAYLERGFDSTCICGSAAAAVACGTLKELNKDQIKNAIAIAASLCGGLNEYVEDGSSPKYLCAGWAAKLGISAVKLAEYGMAGPDKIIEGKLGFCHAFSPKPNIDYMMKPQLNWEVNYVYLKKYSCVRRIHTTLDCIKKILLESKITYKNIKNINVYGGHFIASAAIYDPPTEVKAQTSVPYTVALLIRYGEVSLNRIEDNLKNAEIAELSRRINIIEDEQFNRLAEREPSLWGAVRVELITTENKYYREESHVARGDPEKPFSKAENQEKFMQLINSAWDKTKAESMWEGIQSLEKTQNISLMSIDNILFNKEEDL